MLREVGVFLFKEVDLFQVGHLLDPVSAKITNNVIRSTGFGIFVNFGTNDMEISGNDIDMVGGTGILWDVGVERILVKNNKISGARSGIAEESGISAPGKDGNISGNTVVGAERPIYLLGETGYVIEDNTITNSGSVVLMDLEDTIFRNNDIKHGIEVGDKPGLPSFDGCFTGDGCNLQMVIDCNLDAGVLVMGSKNTLLEGNRIDTAFGEGIRVEPLVREELDNTPANLAACFGPPFARPPGLGTFDVQESTGTEIRSNVIRQNGLEGISLELAGNTKGTQVTLNDIFINGGPAVSSDEAIELSVKEKGNWWHGNCGKGLFVPGPGGDSNAANVVDSFPYNGAVAHVPSPNDPMACPGSSPGATGAFVADLTEASAKMLVTTASTGETAWLGMISMLSIVALVIVSLGGFGALSRVHSRKKKK